MKQTCPLCNIGTLKIQKDHVSQTVWEECNSCPWSSGASLAPSGLIEHVLRLESEPKGTSPACPHCQDNDSTTRFAARTTAHGPELDYYEECNVCFARGPLADSKDGAQVLWAKRGGAK